MTQTLTTEQLKSRIAHYRELAYRYGKSGNPKHEAQYRNDAEFLEELLANREAQPVQGTELAGWQFKSVNGDWLHLIDEHGKNQAVHEGCEVREVYAMADTLNDREAVREAHTEWSQATFGNVGPLGPLKHLSKEALEAAAQPDDLSEWADMQFLLWDAQRRAGITDDQITQAMIEKLAVNKQREWPEPKDGEPRLHITSPPRPAIAIPGKVSCEGFDPKDWVEARNLGQCEGWNAYRAELLAQHVSQGYTLPDSCKWTYDDQDYKWDSACGEAWMFSDGGPTENGVKFCQGCGRPVLLAAAPEGGN